MHRLRGALRRRKAGSRAGPRRPVRDRLGRRASRHSARPGPGRARGGRGAQGARARRQAVMEAVMTIPTHVFREYDIRGLTATELTPEFAEALGRGFAEYLLEKCPGAQSIALGRDHRTSSPALARAFARGARSRGVDVWSIGIVPTPLTYFAANTLPVDGLCMITGSHNPPDYNGFKVGIGKSTLAGSEIQELKERVLHPQARGAARDGVEWEFDVVTPYLHFVTQSLGKAARKLKVVVDPGNGTGAIVAPRLLRALGHQVIELFCELDGSFPNHHPDPTVPENLRDLQDSVGRERADLGVAFDGDSDRLGAVDENGGILWGDQLMIVFARDILAQHPGATIVSEVKCSQTMYDTIEVDGVRVIVPGGWGLIRASNTQPILVLRWEAQSKEKMAELQRLIEGTVDEVRKELQA